jgi:hypothetical protein
LNIVLPPEEDGKIKVTVGGNGGLPEFNPAPVAEEPEPEQVVDPAPEPEPLPKRKAKLKVVSDDDIELTEEILAKMFANMAERGLL